MTQRMDNDSVGCVYTWPLGGRCGRLNCSPSHHCQHCGHLARAHREERCYGMLSLQSYRPCYCRGYREATNNDAAGLTEVNHVL